MKVAIVGCGYVGTATARHLRGKSDCTVTATTTTASRVSELEGVAQRVVVLKGNDAGAIARNADAYRESYLETVTTLVSVLQQTPTVKQVIYTGTYSVYGDCQGKLVNEESPVAPANPNGEILAETERVLLAASNPNLQVCILRLGGIYGPGRELVKIFGRWAGTTRPGAGEDATNWVHRDDIVGGLTFALDNRLQGIYNLVGDVSLSSRELVDRIFETHNLPKATWDTSVSSVRPYNARVSNQKIKAAGYQFIHPEISEF
ncbi:MAG: NAD-dependent epimerase/dehydratase family protein [Microcoleus sp. PH2017_25_DOB_D_A]|uniref:NAD-dependent epimerase/dehydratase family protein n=1 Tax=Microcoleus sp. PH2017_25_DOB_D_A TaxID=2798835 RepID=UPI001D577968|nr:NAD-dependent epimerase/dehydratase family protein [Microcoleus sp. PH2017_25_DOB_D_A]MCC3536166.1 NAD-dependent epimerase/dehydratase family protein [Microcoleus sp. PH2017_25_DOB_D_A]